LNRRTESFLKSVYSHLPRPAKRLGAFADYVLASRVRAYLDPSAHPAGGLKRGSVTLSLDFELAWGWQHSKATAMDFVAKGLHERQQVPKLVRLFEEYDTSTTWATVGHLFLERCARGPNGQAHDEIPSPTPLKAEDWIFASSDFFQFDPCTNVRQDPAWYAPDLIELILKSRTKHEIGCHGFSHGSLGPHCPPAVAAAEVQACVQAMAPFGLRPTTLVFPRHSAGNFDTLARNGVRIVRSFPLSWPNLSLPMPRADGMWGVHVSSALDRGEQWTPAQRLSRLCRLVDAAVQNRLNAHVWLHPSLSDMQMREALVPLVRYCAALRDRGKLDILTMEQLVTQTSASRESESWGEANARAR
jgi:peptidoglycan/xylan/chitin deacetylase (PgdA/CDA1 family)